MSDDNELYISCFSSVDLTEDFYIQYFTGEDIIESLFFPGFKLIISVSNGDVSKNINPQAKADLFIEGCVDEPTYQPKNEKRTPINQIQAPRLLNKTNPQCFLYYNSPDVFFYFLLNQGELNNEAFTKHKYKPTDLFVFFEKGHPNHHQDIDSLGEIILFNNFSQKQTESTLMDHVKGMQFTYDNLVNNPLLFFQGMTVSKFTGFGKTALSIYPPPNINENEDEADERSPAILALVPISELTDNEKKFLHLDGIKKSSEPDPFFGDVYETDPISPYEYLDMTIVSSLIADRLQKIPIQIFYTDPNKIRMQRENCLKMQITRLTDPKIPFFAFTLSPEYEHKFNAQELIAMNPEDVALIKVCSVHTRQEYTIFYKDNVSLIKGKVSMFEQIGRKNMISYKSNYSKSKGILRV